MKSFLNFIKEATSSVAVQQASRMGLQSDGHGGWYDKNGEFVAKTEKGSLKFFNKRQRVGKQDPPQTDKEKNLSNTSYETSVGIENQKEPKVEKPPMVPPEVEKTKGTLTITFGRFNPPTTGHEKLLDKVAASSDEGDYIIVPSRSQNKKKNPLDPDTKVSVMKQMYPSHSEKIVNDPANITIFDVLKKAHNDGYTNVRIVGGGDRVQEFERLSNDYNGKLYAFDNVEVLSAGDRDPDAEGTEGMSASKQRKAAADGDFEAFYGNLHREVEVVDPKSRKVTTELQPIVDEKKAEELFLKLRASMKVEEGWNLWEIAPKFDWKNLRENFIKNKVYAVGSIVENLNTGLIGKIIRRGTNHLICVTEDEIMFKSWIKDVSAVTNSNTPSGVPADQRLVGTDAYRKYMEKMVPGSEWGKKFINKYRKK